MRAGSPEKAEQLARGLADAYLRKPEGSRRRHAAQQSAWLDGKLDDLRGRWRRPSDAPRIIATAQSLVLSDGRVSPEQQLKDANDALVAARGRRAETEARYDQIKAALASGASPESVDATLHSPVIAKLRADQCGAGARRGLRALDARAAPPELSDDAPCNWSATQAQISAELEAHPGRDGAGAQGG